MESPLKANETILVKSPEVVPEGVHAYKRRLWILEDESGEEDDAGSGLLQEYKRLRLGPPPKQKAKKGKLDSERIRNIREAMLGIPPPPSVTNPRISVEEAVERLNQYFDDLEIQHQNEEPVFTNSLSPEDSYLDVYYNENLKCETLDFLYEKVRRRYVMNETCSFVSTAPKFTIMESPLSCDFLDMLPRSISSPASPAPDVISVELAQRRSRMRNGQKAQTSKKPSPRKATMAIKNPSLRMNSAAAQRDAFLLRQGQREQVPKVAKPVTKFITVPAAKVVKEIVPPPSKKTEDKLPKMDELKDTHQKKMIWATAQALKSTSPNLMEDSAFFKKCRVSLLRLCLVQWIKQQAAVDKGTEMAKGTSDRMLELATQLAPQVVDSMNLS